MKNRAETAISIIQNQQHECMNPAHDGDMSFIEAFNVLFKSNSRIVSFRSKREQMKFKTLLLSSLAHRTKAKNVEDGNLGVLHTEDWLLSSDRSFIKSRKREIQILEDIIMGLMIYLLGGFTFPDDLMREEPLKHMKVDVEEIIGEPRKSFLLLNINPAYMLLYLMWKIECLTQALGREFMIHFHEKDSRSLLVYLRRKWRENDHKSIKHDDSGSI